MRAVLEREDGRGRRVSYRSIHIRGSSVLTAAESRTVASQLRAPPCSDGQQTTDNRSCLLSPCNCQYNWVQPASARDATLIFKLI
jgi:hypothetical protein